MPKLLVLAALFASALAHAQQPPAMDFSWLQHSETLLKNARDAQAPAWLKPQPIDEKTRQGLQSITSHGQQVEQQALEAMAKHKLPASAKAALTDAQDAKLRPLVLVSLSIPETNLKGILEEAAAYNAVVVFQGVPKGWTIPKMTAHVGALLKDKSPTIVIDPNVFTELRATAVPVVALPAGNKFVTMRGLVSFDYLKRRVPHPEQLAGKDLGRFGPMFAVAEPNFLDELKRRILAVDWDKKKNEAASRFWAKKSDWYLLPEARESRVRYADPTVVLGQDIKDGSGRVLVRAGKSINPLKYLPLTKAYIVFDASQAWQVAEALKARKEAQARGKGVQLLISHFDTTTGWDGFQQLQDGLKQPVFVLDKVTAERFKLQALPAVVEAEGSQLKIREIARP